MIIHIHIHLVLLLVRWSAHNYQLPFVEYIGGVFLITREDFKKINGYSNEYWGWGVEDLDLLFRIRESDINLESHIDIFNVTKQPRYPLDDVIVRPNIPKQT